MLELFMFPFKLTNQSSINILEVLLQTQTAELFTTTLSPLLVTEQKTVLNTTSSRTHGDQVGVKKDMLDLLLSEEKVSVVFKPTQPSQPPTEHEIKLSNLN